MQKPSAKDLARSRQVSQKNLALASTNKSVFSLQGARCVSPATPCVAFDSLLLNPRRLPRASSKASSRKGRRKEPEKALPPDQELLVDLLTAGRTPIDILVKCVVQILNGLQLPLEFLQPLTDTLTTTTTPLRTAVGLAWLLSAWSSRPLLLLRRMSETLRRRRTECWASPFRPRLVSASRASAARVISPVIGAHGCHLSLHLPGLSDALG